MSEIRPPTLFCSMTRLLLATIEPASTVKPTSTLALSPAPYPFTEEFVHQITVVLVCYAQYGVRRCEPSDFLFSLHPLLRVPPVAFRSLGSGMLPLRES
ncbi:hypothetical protein BDN71DRAFT_1456961 [Pleurotus eryngii]|uniref:Uncharacterized protein n=1 Tax=Pleurotus eryngii TaxID=5323 RepID=A0A9P5ZI52_PLEER|nr:hypothetical protein BDN71DRAFT_1456961 [Pleurotus eryngii]